MALTLERLDHWVTAGGGASPQRIGLSATQRPLEEIARFLGGQEREKEPARDLEEEAPLRPRRVTVVDAGVRKPQEIEVVISVDDLAELGEVVEERKSVERSVERRVEKWRGRR